MGEVRALWRLGAPIILAQLGFVGMGVVDTLLAGPLGAEAMSALALGNTVYFAVLVAGIGLMMALDAHVSAAAGAGRREDCAAGLAQGLWLAVIAAPVLAGAMLAVPPLLRAIGYDERLIALATRYLGPLTWGVLPALWFQAYRSFLAALHVTLPVLGAVLLANAANAALDLWFIHGGLGVPPLGVVGIAWSTAICRVLLLLPTALAFHAARRFAAFPRPWRRPDAALLRALAAVGVPIGLQFAAEVGCFGAVTFLMGLLGPVALAAHQIATNAASVTFMIPFGLAAAAAVRVGHARGAGDAARARRAGDAAFASAAAWAVLSGTALLAGRAWIVRAYRVPDDVGALAVAFLGIAAAFQVGDAVQGVGTGVLRGLADTRAAFTRALAGYALLALPLGAAGAFWWGDDPRWLWYGLTAGLSGVAAALYARFRAVLPAAVAAGTRAAHASSAAAPDAPAAALPEGGPSGPRAAAGAD